jgi:DNA-directed RNA polymerase specialized sigma24 family protein
MKGRLILFASRETTQAEIPADEPSPEMYLYRARTTVLLRRYLRASVELGRVPSLLGREFFRARVTSYRMHNFEDAVIFTHDMERCLNGLDEFSRQVLSHTVLQEYTQEETARIMRVARKTIERAYVEALDRLSAILVDCGMMKRIGTPSEEKSKRVPSDLPPKKPVSRIFACQVGENGYSAASSCKRWK